MQLFNASHQWAKRPDDERFWTVDEMVRKTATYARESRTEEMPANGLRFAPRNDGEVTAITDAGEHLRMTHHSFGQACRTVGAPADYLRGLRRPDLVADCLNHSFSTSAPERDRVLLVHDGPEGPLMRCATSDRYSRIWNYEVAGRVKELERDGWVVPPARPVWGINGDSMRSKIATEDDVIDYGQESVLSVKVGDKITPSGLYASDHDLFAFMVNPSRTVEDGSGGTLMRGMFLWNSEVGETVLGATSFLLRTVCGNHIVWGAEEVCSIKMVHRGDIYQKMDAMMGELDLLTNASASSQESEIRRFQNTKLGTDADSTLDAVVKMRLMPRRPAARAYALATEFSDLDGDPNSVWGFAQGLTRMSQAEASGFADSRNKWDAVAGKLLATV